ncbi:MAG: methyl-accepting chemotaxis protein [Clostridium butyricum]|nr:methyl-accepting chemotaxis protein [Clostridium butyricum]
MKISLKIKLMITFFVLIAIPMSTFGTITYIRSKNALQGATQLELGKQAEDSSDLIEKSIESVKEQVEIASFNAQLSDLMQDPNSEEKKDIAYDYLCKVQKNNEKYMETLIITDAEGKVIIDTQTKEPQVDLSDRTYMKAALTTGETNISDVLNSRFTSNAAIFIAVPVKVNDTTVGSIVGSIKFSAISAYATDIKIGENGYGYMVDKDGLIVAHPNDGKVLKENINDADNQDLKNIAGEMKQMQASNGFYSYEGLKKYVTFKPTAGKWIIAVTAEYNEYMASAIQIRNRTIIVVFIAIIIALQVAYLFSTKYIINPIKYLEELMKKAGDGDLTVQAVVKSNDEIAELANSFNMMIESQEEIVKNVIEASKQLDDASGHLASSAEEISATTEEVNATIENVAEDSKKQNDSVINISEVLVQLSSLVQLAQNRATSTDKNAKESKDNAHLGRLKVVETVNAMNRISTESNETSKVLKMVNDLSIQVGGIVNTINAIAEQTNLLALNAAIEAARAGEDGKGFSVVAEEVRELSEETNKKSKEITGLVDEMMKQTQNAVKAMERANSEVEKGVLVVNDTDEAFLNIIESIDNIAKHVGEILDITSDEVASSDKVINLINDVATIADNNSMNCQNVAEASEQEAEAINNLTATAEETNAMADQLNKLVEKFKV